MLCFGTGTGGLPLLQCAVLCIYSVVQFVLRLTVRTKTSGSWWKGCCVSGLSFSSLKVFSSLESDVSGGCRSEKRSGVCLAELHNIHRPTELILIFYLSLFKVEMSLWSLSASIINMLVIVQSEACCCSFNPPVCRSLKASTECITRERLLYVSLLKLAADGRLNTGFTPFSPHHPPAVSVTWEHMLTD